MVAVDEIISTIMPEFVTETMDNENEHLQHYAVYLMDDLKALQSFYLMEHNLTSIAPIMRSPKQACAIGE